MSKKTFYFTVKENKLVFDDTVGLNKAVIALNDKRGKITIAKVSSQRTLSQNKFYWKWMTVLGEHIGYSKEDMHFVFKHQFLADKMPALSKDVFMAYLQAQDLEDSTKALDSKEMAEYMNQIQSQARELEVQLPQPDDRFLVDY